jgi:hypothetical protein
MTTIPKTAEGIIIDSVEYLSELVISGDQEDHLENWSSLKYFWNQYKQTEGRSKFGRLNARMRMAETTVYALHLLPYEDCGAAKKMKIVPLVKWGPKSWDLLKRKLVGLRDCLVRKDGKRILLTPENEIASPDPNREKSPIYNKQLNDLLVTITANQMISSFRQELERGEPVSQSALEEFR